MFRTGVVGGGVEGALGTVNEDEDDDEEEGRLLSGDDDLVS